MRKLLNLLFLVALVFIREPNADAKVYNNHGLSIQLNNNFKYLSPDKDPNSKIVMRAKDTHDTAVLSLAITPHKGAEPSRRLYDELRSYYSKQMDKPDKPVVSSGLLDIAGGHEVIYVITNRYEADLNDTAEILSAFTWFHHKFYLFTFGYSANSGRRQEMINSLKSITCTTKH